MANFDFSSNFNFNWTQIWDKITPKGNCKLAPAQHYEHKICKYSVVQFHHAPSIHYYNNFQDRQLSLYMTIDEKLQTCKSYIWLSYFFFNGYIG